MYRRWQRFWQQLERPWRVERTSANGWSQQKAVTWLLAVATVGFSLSTCYFAARLQLGTASDTEQTESNI